MVAWRERYEYVRELGEGTSGRVFLARDLAEGGAARALKVCRPADGERLLVEHSRLCAVDSPGVVRVREILRVQARVAAPFHLAEGAVVLVAEVASGESPSALVLAQQDRSERSTYLWRLAEGALVGLCALHGAGLVHGDVKPDNLHCDATGGGVTVLDLGLCRPENENDVVRGTPRMLAPEALLGVCSAAADVYALGATLFDLARGDDGDTAEGRLPWTRDLRQLSERVEAPLAGLIALYLSPDSTDRPEDAYAALEALSALRSGQSVPPLSAVRQNRPRGHVGQGEVRDALERQLGVAGVVLVRGEPGAGRSSLIRAAVQRVQARAVAAGDESPMLVRGFPRHDAVDGGHMIAWIEAADGETRDMAQRASELGSVAQRSVTFVLECAPSVDARGAAVCIDVPALSEAETAALLGAFLGRAPDSRTLSMARARTAGLAGRLCRWIQRARTLDVPWSALESVGTDDPRLPDLSKPAACARDVLAWCGAAPELARAIEQHFGRVVWRRAYTELCASAVFEPGSALRLRSEVARAARARSRHDADVIARVRALTVDGPRDAWADLLLGERKNAEERLLAEGARLRALGEVGAASVLLDEAQRALRSSALGLAAADAERARGRYAAALSHLRGEGSPAAVLLAVDVLRLSGEPALACARAEAAQHALPRDALAELWALWARAEYDRAQLDAAERVLARIPGDAALRARVRAAEVHTLLALARATPARALSQGHVQLARELADPRLLARALGLHAQASGERSAAVRQGLAEAVALAQAAGEAHEAASFALNSALWDLDDGDLGAAYAAFGEAAHALRSIDRPRDRARVLVNFGGLALALGDPSRARLSFVAAAALSERVHDADAAVLARIGEADCAQREGRNGEALARLVSAEEALVPEQRALRVSCATRRAHVHALRQEHDEAAAAWRRAQPLCGQGELAADVEVATAGVRCALARGERDALLAQRDALARLAIDDVSYELRLRAYLSLREAAIALGDERARDEYGVLCRESLERALRGLAPHFRARMRAIPEYARVLAETAQRSTRARSDTRSYEGGRSTRALLMATRLWHTFDEPRALGRALAETALQCVHAERALLLVESSADAWSIVAHAGLSEGDEARHFSRTLLDRVFRDGEVLVSLDVRGDVRLDGARSLHALPMRSVLVAPLTLPSGRAALYLDDRLRSAAFGSEEIACVDDLLELFRRALASVHARDRDRARLKRARDEASALTDALDRAHHALPQREQRGDLVGSSPALARALSLANRVARSDLPVLLQGESGTGKEVFARHLHSASARAHKPFVAESCAALPDSLLESALFGHVRGAFTGADRARRGLFELADGGTLFLDEVGEMSAALQAKLLRVLQSGEFWPVGSERARRADVRVVAATCRDLRRARDAGTFREDLFYRLAVVTIALPALRERRSDIPELALHLLARSGSRARFSEAALAAIERPAYPGNIRELDNVVRRAALLASDGLIEPVHLGDPRVDEPTHTDGEVAGLHAEVDALTERLAREALRRSDNNVTRAAAMLAISRFGLQKIMKRFGLRTPES